MFFFYIFKELLTQTTTTTKAPKQNKGEYAKRDDVATKPKIVTLCAAFPEKTCRSHFKTVHFFFTSIYFTENFTSLS